MQALELSTADRDGHVIVTVKGEINVLTQRHLDVYLSDVCQTGSQVVVDLSGLTFLDASGLSVLLRFWKELNRDGGSLTLAGARYGSARILWTTGLDKRLSLTTDIDQAIALTVRRSAE
ncbi:STAS domain-containing protein [Actinomadura scrupuli]|uniref:STAS domain-containing protein n=1 Tax=Actinomadura scrupuli TaxID=559629 RepID=UPI003D999F05